MNSDATELLRHGIATVAYRGGKVLRDVPPGFGAFDAGSGARTPAQIVAHMGDLFDWAATMIRGQVAWVESPEQDWARLVERFFVSLAAVDTLLDEHPVDQTSLQTLLRGPVADALTHVGQLAMLRRMAGEPIRGENYARARITTGRVGRDQAPAVREF